jgi:Pentapeptide repeats (8 copies)
VIELWQRATIIIDLALLWMLWPSISRGKVTWLAWRDLRRGIGVSAGLMSLLCALLPWPGMRDNRRLIAWRRLRRVVPGTIVTAAAAASAIPVLLVFTISTYPDESLDRVFHSVPIIRILHQMLFAGEPDEVTGRPLSWFSNRLVLTDQSFVDPDKPDKVDVSRSFRGRDLRFAVLSRADLRKADFTGARLNRAVLGMCHLGR